MEPFFFTFAGIYYNFWRLRLKVVVVVIVVVACSQKTVFCLPFRFLFFFPNGLRPNREPFQPAYHRNQPVETHLSSTAAYNTIFVCEGSDNIDKMPKPVLRFFLFHFEKKDFLPKKLGVAIQCCKSLKWMLTRLIQMMPADVRTAGQTYSSRRPLLPFIVSWNSAYKTKARAIEMKRKQPPNDRPLHHQT